MVARVKGGCVAHIHTLEDRILLLRAFVSSYDFLGTRHMPETLNDLWVSFFTSSPPHDHAEGTVIIPIGQRDKDPRLRETVIGSSPKSQGWSRGLNHVCMTPLHQLCCGLNHCSNSSPAPGSRPCTVKLCSSPHKTVLPFPLTWGLAT